MTEKIKLKPKIETHREDAKRTGDHKTMNNQNDTTRIGQELSNGWIIDSEFPGYKGAFGKGYLAKNNDGSKYGYVKVCDLTIVNTGQPGFLDRAKQMIDAFHFERHLLRICLERRMSRVIKIIDDGELYSAGLEIPVPYMIFEYAEGMAKKIFVEMGKHFDHAVGLRCIHGTLAAVHQLHQADIAHQDIKPSNILLVGDRTKIADLGRSSRKNKTAVHDTHSVAGSRIYSPPELLYGDVSDNWDQRRFGCDMYMLGGLIVFYFTKAPLTDTILKTIDQRFHPQKMQGQFEQVLPHLQSVMSKIYTELEPLIPEEYRNDLILVIKQMTAPEPSLRGWPRFSNRRGNEYSLEPYISKIANMLAKADYFVKQASTDV